MHLKQNQIDKIHQNKNFELENLLTKIPEQHIKEVPFFMNDLLEIIPLGILIIDRCGIVVFQNPTCCNILDRNIVGEFWIKVIEKEFSPQVDDGCEVSLSNGKKINVKTSSLKDNQGQLIVLNDLTETRALQAYIEKHRKLYELGKTIAILAHQIRTPLSTVMLHVCNLNELGYSEAKKSDLTNKIIIGLKNIEYQINNMLLFSKPTIPLTDEILLTDLFLEIKENILGELTRSKAKFSTRIPKKMIKLKCNKSALACALNNLVVNALQAGYPEVPNIKIRAYIYKKKLYVCISDNGAGFSSYQLADVVKLFFTTKSNGNGLGMAVIDMVSKFHRAELVLRKRFQGGSNVFLVFQDDFFKLDKY